MLKSTKSTISLHIRRFCRLCPKSKSWQILGGLAVASLTFSTSSTFATEVKGAISVEGDATHVEFSGRENWDYSIERKEQKIVLLLPKMDDATRLRLKSWQGPFVRSVDVDSGPDLKDRVTFELSEPGLQYFDYLTDQPSRLVVDFFQSPDSVVKVGSAGGAQGAKSLASNSKKGVGKNGKRVADLKNARGRRAPASDELIKADGDVPTGPAPVFPKLGVYDGADPDLDRFALKSYEMSDDAVLRSQNNIYLRFPMLTLDQPYLQKMWDNPPLYEVKAEDDGPQSDQNKKARLLLTLFKNQRYATFLTTLGLFRKEFPETKYKELLGYLEADTYYGFWRKEQRGSDLERAISLYKDLLLQFPKSPLTERTFLLLGYTYIRSNQLLSAIQTFERLRRENPQALSAYQAQIAVGQAFQSLKKFEEARAAFSEVASSPEAKDYAIEAAYRLGDTYFEEKKYDFAVAEYAKAVQKYPKDWNKFPNAFYNTAEALFWKSDYKKSLDAYRDFLKRFPASSHGGYALTRVGELLDVLGAKREKLIGAYLECMFRFKGSPGAQIARLRLLSQRMPEMKEKDIEKAEAEIHEFEESSTLPGIKDFTTVILADGYFNRKEFNKSLNLLEGFYRGNTTSLNLDIFRDRIVQNIAEEIHESVRNGKFIESFKIYGKYASSWLKSAPRVDVGYYIGQSFEKAGVPKEAARMYRETLNSMMASKDTLTEKKLRLFEKLPSFDSLNLRLAAVAVAENDFSQAGLYLQAIKTEKDLESSEKIERVELESKVSEATGDLPKAKQFLKALVESWKGKPSEVTPVQLHLAQLQAKTKEVEPALLNLEKIIASAHDTENVEDEVLADALELKGRLFLKQGKKDEAIRIFEDLMDRFEEDRPMGSVRYQVGKLYFDRGDLKSAERTWAALNRPETDLWHKMAQEELQHSSWKTGYKKYLDRIPAMSGFEKR